MFIIHKMENICVNLISYPRHISCNLYTNNTTIVLDNKIFCLSNEFSAVDEEAHQNNGIYYGGWFRV